MKSLNEFKLEREELVSKIKRLGVTNKKILDAFYNTPRHLFVPESLISEAYYDTALPIGENQTISQPSLVAHMTNLLDLKGDEKILEIGTGSGYQSAILSPLVKSVYSIEILPSLATRAKKLLKKLGYKNVFIEVANGTLGFSKEAPYDAIIVTAGGNIIPPPLINQLKEGGRIVIPVGGKENQQLIFGIKKDGKLETRPVEPVRFVPLKGEYGI